VNFTSALIGSLTTSAKVRLSVRFAVSISAQALSAAVPSDLSEPSSVALPLPSVALIVVAGFGS